MSSDAHPPEADPPSALPRGTRLGEFEILRVIGIGGFGIVYLAFDHALEREVAVKEYMPSSLAGRTATMHVSLRSQGDSETFELGRKSFVNEARLLARFDHPSLLKVLRFWEGNGTAYMAMPVYRGKTMKEHRLAMAAPPSEAWLRDLLEPLLGALATLHEAGVFHRDIAPDNIVLEPDGHPVLLDFGAARRVISDKSQTLTAILKPAYAPIEQYAEAGSVKQGPWTDLYALGATLHFMLLGRPPAPATARAIQDDHAPLAGQAVEGCSESFLHVIDWMLAPRPADRPQSVAALRDVLEGRAAPPVRRVVAEPPAQWERTQAYDQTSVVPRSRTQPQPRVAEDDDDGTIIVPPTGAPPQRTAPPPVAAVPPPPPPPVAPPPAAPPAPAAPRAAVAPPAPAGASKAPVFIGLAVVAVAVAAFALWPKPANETTWVTGAASAPAAASAAAPAASVVTAAPVAPPPAPAPEPAPAPPPVVVAAPAPAAEPAPAPRPAAAAPAPAPVARPPVATATPRPPAPPSPAVAQDQPPPRPAPASTPRPAPPALPAASAPAPAPVQLASPRERCGSRVLVALSLCMERECGKADSRQHPECVKWRADLEKLANPTY